MIVGSLLLPKGLGGTYAVLLYLYFFIWPYHRSGRDQIVKQNWEMASQSNLYGPLEIVYGSIFKYFPTLFTRRGRGLWGIWARLSTLLHYISFEIWIVKYSTYMEIYMEIGYWLLFIHLWGGYWSEISLDCLLSSSWTGLDCQEQILKYK